MKVERIGDCELWLGDCLQIIPQLGQIDCVITDSPYSSGGAFRGDRTQKTSTKYVQTDSVMTTREEFSGDNRDQRSFLAWSTIWYSQLLQIAKPGAVLMTFTDWRQLPTMTDAVQCGGWVWRNIVTWWKPGIRMQRGRFSSSSEYVIYASNGVPSPGEFSPQNVLQYAPVGGEDKVHIAEKPVSLMKDLLGVSMPGDVVIDPFMGSATTGVACVMTGRKFIGIELGAAQFETALRRIEAAYAQPRLFDEPAPKPMQAALL